MTQEDLTRLAEIEQSVAIFCMATYGEGDPTDNAQQFHDFLNAGNADMTGVRYAVFALGNKTYEHFNAMGVVTDNKMEEMGGTRLCEIGMGDDDGRWARSSMLIGRRVAVSRRTS